MLKLAKISFMNATLILSYLYYIMYVNLLIMYIDIVCQEIQRLHKQRSSRYNKSLVKRIISPYCHNMIRSKCFAARYLWLHANRYAFFSAEVMPPYVISVIVLIVCSKSIKLQIPDCRILFKRFVSYSFSFFLFLFIILPISLFHSFSISFFLYLILSLSHSFSISFFLDLILSRSHSISISFFLDLILSRSHSFSISFFLDLILSLSYSYFSISFSLFLYIILSLSYSYFSISFSLFSISFSSHLFLFSWRIELRSDKLMHEIRSLITITGTWRQTIYLQYQQKARYRNSQYRKQGFHTF